MIVGISKFKSLVKNQTIILLHDRHENVGGLAAHKEQIALLTQLLDGFKNEQKEVSFYVELPVDFKEWIVKNRAHILPSATLIPILRAVDTDMQDGSLFFTNFDSRGSVDYVVMTTILQLYAQLQQQAKVGRYMRFFAPARTISDCVDAYCSRAKMNNEWFPIMYECTVGNYMQCLDQRIKSVRELVLALSVSDEIKMMIQSRYTDIYTIVHTQLTKLLAAHKIFPATHLLNACAIIEEELGVHNPAAQFLSEAACFVDVELVYMFLKSDQEHVIVHSGFMHTGFVHKILALLPAQYQDATEKTGYLKQGYYAKIANMILPDCLQRLFGWSKPYCADRADLIKISNALFVLPLKLETIKKAVQF